MNHSSINQESYSSDYKISQKEEQPNTSDTLIQTHQLQPKYNLYQRAPDSCSSVQSHQAKLLSYTFQHCDFKWMEEQLRSLETAAHQKYKNNISQIFPQKKIEEDHTSLATLLLMEKFNDIHTRIQKSLHSLSQTRQTISKHLPEKLLKSSSHFTQLHNRKSNLLKYRELLQCLKGTNKKIQKEIQTEEELEEYRDKLKTSGIVVFTDLFESALLRIANQYLKHGLNFSIHKLRNLTSILEDQLSNCVSDSQYLYSLFKKYLLLKRSIIIDKGQIDSEKLDRICQGKILEVMKSNCIEISRTQFEKVDGLVQSCPTVKEFFTHQTLKIRRSFEEFAKNRIQEIGSTLNPDFFNDQNLSLFFKISAKREYLLSPRIGNSLKLAFIVNGLNFIFRSSLQRLQQKYSQRSKLQIQYQNIRLIQVYCLPYQNAIQDALKEMKIDKMDLAKWGCSFWRNQDLLLQKKSWKYDRIYENYRFQIYEWNDIFGKAVIYLSSKLQSLQSSSFNCLGIRSLWIQMISQQITLQILNQKTPTNFLGELTFIKDDISYEVAHQCQTNQQVNSLLSAANKYSQRTYPKRVKKGVIKIPLLKKSNQSSSPLLNKKFVFESEEREQVMQKIYCKLMQLNLKTFAYRQLMETASLIRVNDEIQSIHDGLFSYFTTKK